MSSLTVLIRGYDAPPVSEREILRYAGCPSGGADKATVALMRDCVDEVNDRLIYKVCYCVLDAHTLTRFTDVSRQLDRLLAGCRTTILFGATVGVELDRRIARYGVLSPARALMMQAVGAERIESLCNVFCSDLGKEYSSKLTPRFSAGYGDLPLEAQRDIFSILDCPRHIGLTLNNSLLMSPTKSVTAFVGIR